MKLQINNRKRIKKEELSFSGLDFDSMLASVGGDFDKIQDMMNERPFNSLEMLDYYEWLGNNDDYIALRNKKETERKLKKYGINVDDRLSQDERGRLWYSELSRYNKKLESRRIRKTRGLSEADKGYSSAVYRALDEDFKDGWSGKVDPVYVSDQIELWLMNDKPCYDNIFNNRMKAHSVAYSAMLSLFQDVVDRYDVKVRVTSEMAKQWLKRNGMDYKEVLKPVISRVEEEREERKSEASESIIRKSNKSIKEDFDDDYMPDIDIYDIYRIAENEILPYTKLASIGNATIDEDSFSCTDTGSAWGAYLEYRIYLDVKDAQSIFNLNDFVNRSARWIPDFRKGGSYTCNLSFIIDVKGDKTDIWIDDADVYLSGRYDENESLDFTSKFDEKAICNEIDNIAYSAIKEIKSKVSELFS